MAVKQGFSSHFVRVFGFVSKELWSVLRQPRLIMTLVVGPFLILLIFGLGYTETSDPFRTLIVLENDEARLAADIDDLGDAFGSAIDLVGTTTDRDAGLAQLERGEIELLIVAPEDALGSIENGEKADFTVIHQQVDPIIRQSIELLSRLSVDQINRQVLAAFVGEVQETSAGAEAPVSGLSAAAGGLVVALESDDETAAREERANLERVLETAMEEESSGVESRVAEALGITVGGVLGEIAADLEGTDPSNDEALENAKAVEARLTEFETEFSQARDLDPKLVVSPFGSDVETLNELPAQPAIFYAPGVLMLLVQHLAVTFAALSLVRERELGVTEVFRVSPLSASETMIGKYFAFVVIVGFVAGALTGLMYVFGVPLTSSPWMYLAMVLLVMLASLGLGFVISGLSKTDSQAIQYAMIVLLVSIFFTGFIIPLDRLLAPVQALSYLLPATYGITALHDIVFRGSAADVAVVAGLIGYVLVAGILAWVFARKDVSTVA